MRYLLGANHSTKIFKFLCPQWGSWPYISKNFLIWTNFVNASWKKRTYACKFRVQRKEINVRFTMRYFPRKLSHEKAITTACNFWRQIDCSFLVKSGNVLLLGKNVFEIPPFFQTRPGDLGEKVHACSLRFSALNVNAAISTRATLVGGECSNHCAITFNHLLPNAKV